VLHFVEHVKIIKNNLFETPPLFSMIQSQSNTDWHEMYKVFNMGNLLEFYTDEKTADILIGIAKKYGVDARIIGYVDADSAKSLEIHSAHGRFVY
jgi:phosphoribosylformylglycinamidine cyclo-ligase